MKKFKLKNPLLLFVLLISILVVWPLFMPGYFSHHDDLHVIRIFEMRRCFADLQIPCRWVPDMGYGFGIPLFNFYNPAVYYLGALFSFVTGFVGASKLLFLIALLLGPVGMYFLAKELWGKWAGVVASTVFLFAPYRALDAYVRGALSELFAYSLIPFIFLFVLRLSKNGSKKDFVILTLISALFLVSHNVSVIIWAPFIFIWALYCIYMYSKSWIAATGYLICCGLFAVGLSAFFTIPAFTERGLVTTGTLTTGDLDYHVHFTNIRQLFLDRMWGYGASKYGPNDELSLQIGWPHWWGVIFAIFLLILRVIRSRTYKLKKEYVLPLLLISFFLISTFMTHNKSTPIWNTLDIFAYLQFPWRYLAVSTFAASLLAGFVSNYFLALDKAFAKIVGTAFIVLAVAINWQYFRPQYLYTFVNDNIKLSGDLWEMQQKGSLLDYLPLGAEVPEKAANGPVVTKRGGEIRNFLNYSNSWQFEMMNASPDWEVVIPVFDFPNWEVSGATKIASDHGLIKIKGSHDAIVKGVFKNTPARSFGNIITVLSFVSFVFLLVYAKNKKIFRS